MSWLIVITLAAVGSVAVAALLLWWWVPKWQMRSITAADPKARADIEDTFRKTIGQLVVGAMVLVGAGAGALIAYLQLSQQQLASRDLLISNQVAKGFEQLGSDKEVVRLGGIYALEGVMKTSEQYHQPVLEALSAFVRDGTKTATGDGPPATDIQAALTVIGRRKVIGREEPDLSNAHIPQAQLRDADLRATDLSGADLSNADLRETDLSGANLHGAHLIGANLSGEEDMGPADLTGADLSGANLSGAKLSLVNLGDADLRETDLSGADLSNADLSHADLSSVHLDGADLHHATVTQVQLDGACGTNVKLDPDLTLKPCP
jgi:uncharacterized protein YjbI with pentapeptide repeats